MGIKLGNIDISAFKVGSADCKVYLGTTLLYSGDTPTPPTPTGSTCYEVIPYTISSYSSTTYDSVYSYTDGKWYMLNNLDVYEEYGIYDTTGSSLSDYTYYDGKLVAIGTTEYQRSGDTWVEVGTYEDESVTYTIDNTYPSPYIGETLSTTFKILVADVEALGGWLYFSIRTSDGGELSIGTDNYDYRDSDWETEQGTVTNDGTYYNYSLPNTQSIVIQDINYWDSNPIHLIVGSKQITVVYQDKDMPLGKTYSSVAEMELDTCPTVGVNQYGVVGNNAYQFNNMEEWDTISSYKFIGKYGNIANVVECNSSSVLTSNEINPNYISSGLTSGIIGLCVTSVDENAFQGSSIISIEIPNSVTNIGSGAFTRCSSLTSCTIPSGVTSIDTNTFYNCSSLTSVDIPSGVTSIGSGAFYYCTSLTSVTIPNGVTTIPLSTFNNCTSLSSATIPNSVTSIGSGAFQYAGLVNLYIPSSVTSICANTFTSCSKLESIIVDSSNSVYDSRNNCNALIITSTNELIIGCKNTVIPNGITTIGNSAFISCTGLTGDFDIPNSVTTIGSNTFRLCSGLTSCSIGSGVTSIDANAFRSCKSLTSITINATTPPALGDSVFSDTNNCPIYVPSGSVNAYKAASGWSDYASRIQAIPSD